MRENALTAAVAASDKPSPTRGSVPASLDLRPAGLFAFEGKISDLSQILTVSMIVMGCRQRYGLPEWKRRGPQGPRSRTGRKSTG